MDKLVTFRIKSDKKKVFKNKADSEGMTLRSMIKISLKKIFNIEI